MTEALYLLSPPPRKQLIDVVVKASTSLVKRLELSREVAKRVDAEVRVGRRVLYWWRDLKQRKKMAALMNFTTKAVKINKELHKLYDRSQESVADDGSLADSLVDEGDENASQNTDIHMVTNLDSNDQKVPTEDVLGMGGNVLEQGSATSVPET